MMSWGPDHGHHHNILDRWRVSSLIRAVLELILALCVFLCAVICVTTARFIKSSGLFDQTCAAFDTYHQQLARGKEGGDEDVNDYPKLHSCDVQRTRGGNSYRDPPTPMNISCEDCTLALADCACTLKRGSLADNNNSSPGLCRRNVVVSVSNNNKSAVDFGGSGQTIRPRNDDDNCGRKRRGESCSSFENLDSSCDGSERIMLDCATVTAGGYGCECRRCIGLPGLSSPPSRSTGRAVKRKIATVFPNDSRACSYSSCCCDHPPHIFEDSSSLIISGGEPAEIRESVEDLSLHTDGSDGSDDQHPGNIAAEDSVRVSSQESFSYHTRRSTARGLSRLEISMNRSKLSIDTDLLGGESTPEWCGSLADSPAVWRRKEMEEEQEAGSTFQHDNDPEIGVMELREALQEERENLSAVYLELEEERSAASSAAHEAMAMITRLQEEKAAVQMEARQYQRMAEEKHQYDQESMAMLQEILLRRDEEVYALEEEVNLYRNRLLTLGLDGLLARSVGAGREDVLLIEQETLLLDGSEAWKNERDRGDQKLFAEIKEWLQKAREKIVFPEKIEELNVPAENVQKISGNRNRFLPGSGRKNLFESFSSVTVEDRHRDGIVVDEFESQRDGIANEELEEHRDGVLNKDFESHRDGIANEEVDARRDGIIKEEFEARRDGIINEELEACREGFVNGEFETHKDGERGAHRDTAAGYESFQGMMESLRQEPSLRDEESLETLKKIEEKFQRQSSQGEVRRSGDELRQIWKNTLRSFEKDERDDAEASGAGAGGAEFRAENLITTVDPATNTGNSADQEKVIEAAGDADRTVGEKRMSVLEYVWKFEEQLHQLGNKKTPLAGKLVSSTSESVIAEASPELKGEFMDSDKSKKSNWTRLRKLATASHAIAAGGEGRNATPDAERDRTAVRAETPQFGDRVNRVQDAKLAKSQEFEEESSQDKSSVVHDVYEVQRDPQELTADAISHRSKGKRFKHDIKRYVSSTVSELVSGQFIDSHETARSTEHYLVDDGRPDFIADHALEEHEANGQGRPDQSSSAGSFPLSFEEPGMCAQADRLEGDCVDNPRGSDECASQSASSAFTDSPEVPTQDVVRKLKHKLQVLESDRQMMQDTIAALKRENGDMKLLQDITRQLRELQGMEQAAADNPGELAFVPAIKGMLTLDKLDSFRHSVQSQMSKMAQLFLGTGGPAVSRGGQHVGQVPLLQESPLSKKQEPPEKARGLKAGKYATHRSHLDAQFQPPSATSRLVCQSWPNDAKERSETAFSGWDY